MSLITLRVIFACQRKCIHTCSNHSQLSVYTHTRIARAGTSYLYYLQQFGLWVELLSLICFKCSCRRRVRPCARPSCLWATLAAHTGAHACACACTCVALWPEATSISMGARGEGGKEGERARGITQERFHDLEYNAEQPTKTELFSQNHQRTIEEQLRTTHKN